MFRRFILGLASVVLLPLALSAAVSVDELNKRIDQSEKVFDNVMSIQSGIPASLLKKAHGVVILKQYRGGFIWGGKGGNGVAFKHNKEDGTWSGPAFVTNAEGSFGLQIGGGSVDSVFLLMNEEGMKILNRSKVKIGADVAAAAGPWGRDAEAKVGPEAAILAYSKAAGLYAGASIEGGVMTDDDEANSIYYDTPGIKAWEIISSDNEVPEAARSLADKLTAAAQREEEAAEAEEGE